MTKTARLFWVDCEMTGLDFMGKDKIMEFASVVTDGALNVIKQGPEFIVHIDETDLAKMDEWCTRTHGQTGLTEKCRKSKETINAWDVKVAEFIRENCPKAPIAGNSVHMDLNFMRKEMPLSTGELHYRIVDVSTVKELAMRLNPAVHERRCEMIKKDLEAEEKGEFVPEGKHTAKYDIYKSIDEMKFYQKHFLITE